MKKKSSWIDTYFHDKGYIMIVYKDHITFTVLGQEINLYSEQLETGPNTVAEMEKRIYYLGHEHPSVGSAILAWQGFHGRELTADELRQALTENYLTLGPV
jgi:hypothetical protein